jgi:hypothetical protein
MRGIHFHVAAREQYTASRLTQPSRQSHPPLPDPQIQPNIPQTSPSQYPAPNSPLSTPHSAYIFSSTTPPSPPRPPLSKTQTPPSHPHPALYHETHHDLPSRRTSALESRPASSGAVRGNWKGRSCRLRPGTVRRAWKRRRSRYRRGRVFGRLSRRWRGGGRLGGWRGWLWRGWFCRRLGGVSVGGHR